MSTNGVLSPKVDEYADKNLAQVGEVRLKKLGKNDLCELFRRIAVKTNASSVEDSALDLMSPTELVEAILRMKPKLPKPAKATATKAEPAPAPAPEAEPAPAPAPEVAPEVSAVVKTHTLRICSFNSNKLGLDKMWKAGEELSEETQLLRDHWVSLVDVMSQFDVIVMQEIPKSEVVKPVKTTLFSMLLHAAEPGAWRVPVFSAPSGRTDGSAHLGDVHACWLRSVLTVERGLDKDGNGKTLSEVVIPGKVAVPLDYAPLQLVIRDDRFVNPDQRRFVLTSVHLPPGDRAAARDAQLEALLSGYGDAGTSENRLGTRFDRRKSSGAKEQGEEGDYPIHVVAGDFNVYPGAMTDTKHGKKLDEPEEAYGLTRSGFVAALPEGVATSVGNQHYDNFLVDAHSSTRYQINSTVLRLVMPKNPSKSQAGLSDHHPIVLEIIDTATVKSRG